MKRRNWIVIALLVAGWFILIGQPSAIATKLRMICVQLSTPFVKLGDYIPTVKDRRDLDRQNRELRAINDRHVQELKAFAETATENVRLNRVLAFKERLPYRTLGARIIGRDSSTPG